MNSCGATPPLWQVKIAASSTPGESINRPPGRCAPKCTLNAARQAFEPNIRMDARKWHEAYYPAMQAVLPAIANGKLKAVGRDYHCLLRRPSMVECARIATVLLVVLMLTTWVQAGDWPQWRGPNRDGVWNETGILEQFPSGGLKICWRARVGNGFSSAVVVGDRVWRPLPRNSANAWPSRPTWSQADEARPSNFSRTWPASSCALPWHPTKRSSCYLSLMTWRSSRSS